ncbi:hypothetical protein ANN_02125 [Periplaneta americana]|uniref:aspartate transaminase n=1 Tax=Periplaneta americana TaxID=6978 RepID=A0ABQ8TX17_PERAM|nr:hypothetical protein ANN_02125 [Periplaneta americana]
MIMSRDGNIVRNGNINIGDLSFEEVEKFKYLGATVTNINDTREEIKRRINMGNACYYSVEKLLSSSLLSKNLKVRIYKTVILPVLLYGCETWTLTLREEHRLRVVENKVLRKIFGAKRDEVTGEWRKLHNTELHTLYSSPDIIRNLKSRRLRWAGHVARMGESRNAYRVLVGRPEGKRPLGRPRRRWEDNIKMDLREVGYDDRDWLTLAQDRDRWRAYVRAAMNLRDSGQSPRDIFNVAIPDNHEYTFLYSGLKNSRIYRYWDPVTKGVDFKGMIEDLMQAPENSIIVLQMCSHNPTGCDLTKEQWIKVADVMEERKLFPFFDAAYQGFSTGGLETDAWPVRYFVDRGFELFIAQTFSKNMGLYSTCDRVGSLIVVLKEGRQKEVESIKLMLTVIIRALYLCPTKHGAEIVIQTLKSPELYKEWLECLKMMVKRLKAVRQGLKDRLVKLGTPGNWDHITEQTGMFSFTGLSGKQVAYLAKQYHIYLMPNGRANMCALNMNNLDAFAKALHNAVINIPA